MVPIAGAWVAAVNIVVARVQAGAVRAAGGSHDGGMGGGWRRRRRQPRRQERAEDVWVPDRHRRNHVACVCTKSDEIRGESTLDYSVHSFQMTTLHAGHKIATRATSVVPCMQLLVEVSSITCTEADASAPQMEVTQTLSQPQSASELHRLPSA